MSDVQMGNHISGLGLGEEVAVTRQMAETGQEQWLILRQPGEGAGSAGLLPSPLQPALLHCQATAPRLPLGRASREATTRSAGWGGKRLQGSGGNRANA